MSEHFDPEACHALPNEELAAWVDGAAGAEASKAAAHVAACPRCQARASELRDLKSRMGLYAASTLTAPPPGWIDAALDRAMPDRAPRPRLTRLRFAGQAAALCLLSLVVLAALTYWLRPQPAVPVDRLLVEAPHPLAADADSFPTSDPSRAAEWLRRRLGSEVPAVSLSLARAEMLGARYHREERAGELVYRDAVGRYASLYLYPGRRIEAGGTTSVEYRGQTYRLKRNLASGVTAAFWSGVGVEYAAVGRMEREELLPLVHEMARRCR